MSYTLTVNATRTTDLTAEIDFDLIIKGTGLTADRIGAAIEDGGSLHGGQASKDYDTIMEWVLKDYPASDWETADEDTSVDDASTDWETADDEDDEDDEDEDDEDDEDE